MLVALFSRRKAQSTAEYAIVFGLVVAAVLGMQTYTKRALQAKQRDATQDFFKAVTTDSSWATIGGNSNAAPIQSGQYEPEGIESQMTQTQTADSGTNSTIAKDGTATRSSVQGTKQGTGDYQMYKYTPTPTQSTQGH